MASGLESKPVFMARARQIGLSAATLTLLVDGGQHLQSQPRDVMFLARDALKAPG